ncbi:hypothetical protein G7054_g15097 [Neopestalotiopsis clavispora]|nr:hypothetical protein G7054_g15097 [Neopestalotiopsis clavispora]
MATATSTTTAPTAKDLAQQILEHRAPSYTFTFSPFLRKTYGHGLAPNRPPGVQALAARAVQKGRVVRVPTRVQPAQDARVQLLRAQRLLLQRRRVPLPAH